MSIALKLEKLTVSYGAIQALKGIDIEVQQGSIVALLGANGAGKSTVLRAISGIARTKSGRILLHSAQSESGFTDITNKEPYKIASLGVIQSPEGRLILAGLTVEDNLFVGAYALKKKEVPVVGAGGEVVRKLLSVREQKARNLEKVYRLFPILQERRRQQANTLSGGEQQMLAIGRALMASPEILLLDEPSLGLAPLIVRSIFQTIEQLKKEGATILIVEQNAYQTLNVADYAYVLELGRINMQGKASTLIKDEKLVEAYLGSKK